MPGSNLEVLIPEGSGIRGKPAIRPSMTISIWNTSKVIYRHMVGEFIAGGLALRSRRKLRFAGSRIGVVICYA